jgi:hypothetical protein
MPTDREREYYRMGFDDGLKHKKGEYEWGAPQQLGIIKTKRKRSLSAWQKFVKVNSKKPRFRYKSGSKKGKINLKALGVAYRKKRR